MEQLMKEVQLYDAKITAIRPITEQVLSVSFTTGANIFPGQQLFFNAHQHNTTPPHAISQSGGEYMIVMCRGLDTEADPVCFNENDIVPFAVCNGKIQFDEQATHHFFFGNEHATGLFKSYKELAEARDHEYFGVAEMTDQNAACLQALQLMLEHVPATPETPAANAIQWMEEMHPLCWNTWKDATFYLPGNDASSAAFRKYLLQKGVPANKIRG
ncbi:hypothetical protein ACTHGU_02015 [Chitinophagaceae bacterium MMS25-I14]